MGIKQKQTTMPKQNLYAEHQITKGQPKPSTKKRPQPLINRKDKSRARRRSRARNSTTTIHALKPLLPPQRPTNRPKSLPLGTGLPERDILRLKPRFDRVGWVEEEIVAYSRRCAGDELLVEEKCAVGVGGCFYVVGAE
jgi:hypothetical protein